VQPDLNGALFVKRSGTKKREWKADKAAQIILLPAGDRNKIAEGQSSGNLCDFS